VNWVYQFDMSGFRAINLGLHRPWLDPFFMLLSYSGLGVCPTLAPFLFLLSKSTRHYVLPLLINVFVSGIVLADGVKELLPRDRPSNMAFAIRQESHLLGSFPSGHTTTSFGFAMMITFLTWNTKYRKLGYSSFVWATLVGISRIYRGVHWPTDVLAGVCFGVASACMLYLLLPKVGIAVEKESEPR
jgi:undecaprenyl-diphosphatase